MTIYTFNAYDFATGNLVGQTEAGGPPALGGLQVQTRPVVDFLQNNLGLDPSLARIDLEFRDKDIRTGNVDQGNPQGDAADDIYLQGTNRVQRFLIDADGDGTYDYEVIGQNPGDLQLHNSVQEGDYLARFNGNLRVYKYDGDDNTNNDVFVGNLSQGNMFVSSNGPFGAAGTITPTYDATGPSSTFVLPCFVSGTQIVTARGLRKVEDIIAGDLIVTRDHGVRPVAWAGGKFLSADYLAEHPEFAPVQIRAGAIGNRRALSVSPQHRILMRGQQHDVMVEDGLNLIPATALVGYPGVERFCPKQGVTYHHLLFADHEIVFGDGVPSESLQPGTLSEWVLPTAMRAKVKARHGAALMKAAYPTLTGAAARIFMARGAVMDGCTGRQNRPELLAG